MTVTTYLLIFLGGMLIGSLVRGLLDYQLNCKVDRIENLYKNFDTIVESTGSSVLSRDEQCAVITEAACYTFTQVGEEFGYHIVFLDDKEREKKDDD